MAEKILSVIKIVGGILGIAAVMLEIFPQNSTLAMGLTIIFLMLVIRTLRFFLRKGG